MAENCPKCGNPVANYDFMLWFCQHCSLTELEWLRAENAKLTHLLARLRRCAAWIDNADRRALACDGPVPPIETYLTKKQIGHIHRTVLKVVELAAKENKDGCD